MYISRLVSCLSFALVLSSPLFAQAQGKKHFGQGHPFALEELPNGELKSKLKQLDPKARDEAMKQLHTFSFPETDAAKYLKADNQGGIFIICPINGCECDDANHDHGNNESAPQTTESAATTAGTTAENMPIGDGSNDTFSPTTSVSVASPPVFNSKPGAPFHIYLDFNGAYVTGKAWTYNDGTTTWSTWDCAAWSTDTDPATFSVSEQNDIRRMWERIAEDYAPFNVNVTTDVAYDPDNYTGDKNKVGWLLTTPTTDKAGVRCPHYGYGGVAYVNVFGRTDFFSRYQPAWVTPMGTANTAEAASHEMGHNLGLSHDGLTTGAAYYGGHVATTTAPSWGPIMGTGYNRNVSQWSKGEYLNGNQTQDDLAIIAGKVQYRTDDHGDTFQNATGLTQVPVNQVGVIETTGNQDVFAFTTAAGTVSFNANAYRCDTQTWGANLDVILELYNSSQTLVTTSNPAADVNASISTSVAAGTYYLVIKPSDAGSSLISPPSGYSLYGSLGYYNLTGNFSPANSPGSLAVSPAGGLTSSGSFGGAFSPSSLVFTLNNPGTTAINWSAAKTQSWVTLSSASGSLAAGASTTVTASINTNANTLNVGSYNDTVTFTNTSNGTGNTTRPVALTVSTKAATITLGNLSQTYNGSPKSASVTTNPAGLTYSITYAGSATPPTNAGTYAVVANITQPNYSGSSSGSLVIAKASQTIAFAALNPVSVGSAPFSLTATASSGLTVSYSSSNTAVATVSGSTVTILAAGSTTITATQPGNTNYNPATAVQQTLTVTTSNTAPVFLTDPIIAASAIENNAYTGQTLAGQATDPDAGATITYSKVSGPAWLSVASNGALSGTPPTGSAGLNSFIVRATDNQLATKDATLQITVSELPLPWLSNDIGTGMLAGSATFNNGTFTQAGSGVIDSTTDKLRFTYQTLTGDGEIIARISGLQNTGKSSRVGVMIRDSLAANSKQVFMGMTSSNAYRWVRRTTTGGSTSSTSSSTGTVPNTWVRLVRSGTTITAYKSSNGTSWTSVGSTTNTTFGSTCYIGLAVGSGSTTTLNTSQFSSVTVTP